MAAISLFVLSTILPSVLALPQGQGIARPTTHQGSLLISAKRIHISPDRMIEDSAILIRDGVVLYVGTEIPVEARTSADKIDFPDGTVIPGLVNAHSSLGHGAELAERIDTFTPELLASDAFDPFIEDVMASAASGITTVGLAPSSFNSFAGQGAAIHTGSVGRILLDSTYLKMSLVDAAFDRNRFPTSRMGAADLIRTRFNEARTAIGPVDNRLKVLADVINGSRLLALHVQTESEIDAALDLCAGLGLRPILVGCEEGHKRIDRIAALSDGVVLAPLSFDSPANRLTLPGKLEQAGVPFSFMAERPADLRISAAAAVRHGLSQQTALAALTLIAAQHTEADERVGTLHEGKSADLCVYSGNPLDLTSRLIGVYVAGVRIVNAPEEK
ncbi:MAG: hypothetical protein CMJ89_20900 [Planctomycetes bacterium]|nr:hypothetical protein [Planctomycetota bacterium]